MSALDRELAVWQFTDAGTGFQQYIDRAPAGDHVRDAMPLYYEPNNDSDTPDVWKHTVVEPAAEGAEPVTMTIYTLSQDNPWEGKGACTTVPLYT